MGGATAERAATDRSGSARGNGLRRWRTSPRRAQRPPDWRASPSPSGARRGPCSPTFLPHFPARRPPSFSPRSRPARIFFVQGRHTWPGVVRRAGGEERPAFEGPALSCLLPRVAALLFVPREKQRCRRARPLPPLSPPPPPNHPSPPSGPQKWSESFCGKRRRSARDPFGNGGK